jgi:N-acetylglutamate synthase-like GNAT family acetyltransferase
LIPEFVEAANGRLEVTMSVKDELRTTNDEPTALVYKPKSAEVDPITPEAAERLRRSLSEPTQQPDARMREAIGNYRRLTRKVGRWSLSGVRFVSLNASHDTARFRCGSSFLDQYLAQNAMRDQEADRARTFVALDSDGVVIGFFTLRLIGQYLPALSPGDDDEYLGLAEIACLAHSLVQRGTGLGDTLLLEAFVRLASAAETVGLPGAFLYATQEGEALYERFGFLRLYPDKREFFIPMTKIRTTVAAIEQADEALP